ncbi:hypothetical protein QQS21_000167 [Conoideocrella luteorostrata]|uniref:Zn(2)-C6 fungal-type domain-containing protein n=1 Tax=Conoideocrella luteorostrata TaxID=1105319 RepID=A0AAJ0FZD6_9HYPO|nr:hypothetical protein QQS21_000167 [Conoideocrella luteorostrata]
MAFASPPYYWTSGMTFTNGFLHNIPKFVFFLFFLFNPFTVLPPLGSVELPPLPRELFRSQNLGNGTPRKALERCDETKPFCKQCTKSRRTCPGYKAQFDLFHVDETLHTQKRAAKARSRAGEGQKNKHEAKSATRLPRSQPGPTTVKTIQQPLEVHAACHFVSNYVVLHRQGKSEGLMVFVIRILQADKVPVHFQYAFEACALASLNNSVGTRNHFEREALGKYTKALSATFAAIQDPATAKQDATLASVLLLGLFENISVKVVEKCAWGSHIDGAMQLIKLRGPEQLKTKVGLDMFLVARMQMVILGLSSPKPPEYEISWWTDDANRDAHAAKSQKLCVRASLLRHETRRLMSMSQMSCSTILIKEMIKKCQALDEECVEWSATPPKHFRYTSVAWINDIQDGNYAEAEAYIGSVDAYSDLYFSTIWNVLRCARITLYSLIVRCLARLHAPADYRTIPEYEVARRTTIDIVDDLIASVPYQLGWFRKHKTLINPLNLSSFICGEDDSLKGVSGQLMNWPLGFVHALDYLTDSQRTWVRGRLEYIGSQLGVRSSLIFAKTNYRIPSTLVLTDLLAAQSSTPSNFERLLPARISSLTTEPPAELRVQQQQTEQRDLAASSLGDGFEQRAKNWLELQRIITKLI